MTNLLVVKDDDRAYENARDFSYKIPKDIFLISPALVGSPYEVLMTSVTGTNQLVMPRR